MRSNPDHGLRSRTVQVKAGELVAIAQQLRALAATIEGMVAVETPPEPYAVTLNEAAERLGYTTKDVLKLLQHSVLDNSPGKVGGLVMVTTRSVEHAKTIPLAALPARRPRGSHYRRHPWRPLRIEDLSR